MSLNKTIVKDTALEWFGEMGYVVGHGPHLSERMEDAVARYHANAITITEVLQDVDTAGQGYPRGAPAR